MPIIKPPRSLLALLTVAVCLVALTCVTGCQEGLRIDRDEALATITAAEAEVEAADTFIAALEEQLATLPEGETRDETLELLAAAREKKAKYSTIVADVKAWLEGAEDPNALDLTAAGLQSAGRVAPPPWGTYLGLAGLVTGAVSELLRRRTKSAAENVVVTLERVKNLNDGAVDFADPNTKTQLESRMSTPAKRLVEQARAKAPATVKLIRGESITPTT